MSAPCGEVAEHVIHLFIFFTHLLFLALQHVPTKNDTNFMVTNFFRIPLSYLSQIGKSKRQVTQENIAVILDCPESIGKCNHEKAKQAMKNMLDIASEIGYDNRYAVVTLATGATTGFNFVANLDAGFKIKNLPFIPRSTNTQAALKEAKRILKVPIQVCAIHFASKAFILIRKHKQL